METMTAREHYKTLYREARRLLTNADERGAGEGVRTYRNAYNLADDALSNLAQSVWAYAPGSRRFDAVECCGDIFAAVLWAIHWKHFPPVRDDVPNGMSERHLCFEITEAGSRTWYARRLP